MCVPSPPPVYIPYLPLEKPKDIFKGYIDPFDPILKAFPKEIMLAKIPKGHMKGGMHIWRVYAIWAADP